MKRGVFPLLLFFTLAVKAQFVPTTPTADFGIIDETAGKAPLRIYVVNADSVARSILKVNPSCGCTAAEFQKDPVAPGDSAWIDIIYDPYLRPGKIDKLVRVSPIDGEVLRIPITGVVKASEETIARLFPADGDLLHLTETTFLTLRPLTELQRSFYADAYNGNDFPVTVEIDNDNDAIEWLVTPNPVPPFQKASIGLYVYPDKEKDPGVSQYNVTMHTSATPEETKTSKPIELKILFNNHGTP